MARSLIKCTECGKESLKSNSQINRSVRDGKPLYCNKKCFGLAQRSNKTHEELKEEKRVYDSAYRDKNIVDLKRKKAEYFKRTYDPVKAAIERKKGMANHVEYCRQPAYKAKKKVYDRQYRAKQDYGELWEVQILTLDIQEEVESRMEKQQIRVNAGTYNKCQRRHRDEKRLNSEEFERRTLGNAK